MEALLAVVNVHLPNNVSSKSSGLRCPTSDPPCSWLRIGANLDLLDSPGVLPARLQDQAAAARLAICNDIGQAAYAVAGVAVILIEYVKRATPKCETLATTAGTVVTVARNKIGAQEAGELGLPVKAGTVAKRGV
jgi:hypothetical protein